jgi:galactokinase
MVKHTLAASAYQDRVAECAAAVELIRSRFPAVKSLRDVTAEQLKSVALPDAIARRARHVISENVRVERFVEAARSGNLASMGGLLFASHRSLRDDYEVSCPELDFIVDTALHLKGVYGARMTGGGFGGCAVVMLPAELEEEFSRQLCGAFQQQFGIEPRVYICRASDGANEVNILETIPAAAN